MSLNPRSFKAEVCNEVIATYQYLAYISPAGSVEGSVYRSVASILHRVIYKHRLVEEIHMVIAARRRYMDGYPPRVRQEMFAEVACYERVLEQLRKGRIFLPAVAARTVSFRDDDF